VNGVAQIIGSAIQRRYVEVRECASFSEVLTWSELRPLVVSKV
jgi:hypothetical protein